MHAAPEADRSFAEAAEWRMVRVGLDVAYSVHLHVEWVARRAATLADSAGQPVSANAYRSRGGALGMHHDADDALVLQVDGRRRWWLHPPTDGRRPPAPDRWHTLGPSAELELPAGWWHEARLLTAESVHITFTLHRC